MKVFCSRSRSGSRGILISLRCSWRTRRTATQVRASTDSSICHRVPTIHQARSQRISTRPSGQKAQPRTTRRALHESACEQGHRCLVRSPRSFDVEGLRQVYAANSGEGLDSGLPDWLRFLSGVVECLLARRESPSGGNDQAAPCIFFLGDPIDTFGVPQRKSTFIQGEVAVNGSMWFMNEEARRGYGVEHQMDAETLLGSCPR